MKKIVLFAAQLGLITVPVASLIACGSVWGHEKEDEKNHDKDDNKKIVVDPKDSYTTALADVETLSFEIGERHSAVSLGIADAFNDEFEFEIKDYDDLKGTLIVSVEHSKDSTSHVLRTDVKVGGFKTISSTEFLKKITQDLPEDGMLPTDLTKKQKPSELRTLDFLNVENLGIDKHFRFRKAEHRITVFNHNDAVGELVVDLKISIAGDSLTTRLTITNLAMDDPVLKERLDQINQAMREIKDAQTSQDDVLPSRVMQRLGDADFWDQLGIGQFPSLDSEIKVTFSRGRKTSDETGQIELIVKFETSSGANSLVRTKVILISGFLTTEGTKYDLSHIKAQQFKNYLENEFHKITTYKQTLPSEVKKEFLLGKKRDLAALGLEENFPERYQSGIDMLIEVGTADDKQGTLSLTITIRVGKAKLVSNLLIQGYATKRQIEDWERQKTDQELRELLAHIRKNHNHTAWDQKLPSQVGKPREVVTFTKLGLKEIDQSVRSGIEVELRIILPNDQTGEIELEITVSKNNQKLEELLIVGGYKTIDQVTRENKAKVVQQLKDLLDWISEHLTLTSHTNMRPSKVGLKNMPATLPGLGLPNLSEERRSGALLTFEIVEPNDFDGTLEVKVTALKEGQSATKTYVVAGYKTHQQEIEDLFAWAKNNLTWTNLIGKLPSEIAAPNDVVSFKDLGLRSLPAELFSEYETKLTVVNPSDQNGSIEVELTIRKDTREKSVKEKTRWWIVGYKSSNDVRDDLVAKMNWIVNNLGFTIHRDKMPSSIGRKEQAVDFKTLGIRDLIELSQQGIRINMVLVDWNDVKGEVKLRVTLSHRGVTYSDQIMVQGFKKVDDQLTQVMDLIKANLKTTKRDLLPSLIGHEDQIVTFDDLGLSGLTEEQKQGAKVVLTVVFPNDQKGTIKVKVKLTKESQSKEFEITVAGFKTLKDQIKEIEKQVKRLSEWMDHNWTKTSLGDKLPSMVGVAKQEIDLISLGLKELPHQFKENFVVTITIDHINQEQGEIRVKVIITNSGVREEKTILIGGYKKVGTVRDELDSVFDQISENWAKSVHSQKMPSELGQLGQEISHQKMGLKPDPVDFSQDTSFKLVLWKIDDLTGKATVKIFLSKEGVEITRDLTVSGFKKVGDQIQEVLTLIKQRLAKIKVADKLPSYFGEKGSYTTLSLLGVAELSAGEDQGVLVKILVQEVDDQNGRLSIVLELSKKGVIREEPLTLEGFLKNSDVDNQKVAEIIQLIRKLNGASPSDDQIRIKQDPKARFWAIDMDDVTIDLIKNNASDWKISLPKIPIDIELNWKLISVTRPPESTKLVKFELHLFRGSARQILVFVLEGFRTDVEELIDSKWEQFPTRLHSKLTRKLVSEFVAGRLYSFAMLGVDISEFETEPLNFEALVTGFDDPKGSIEIRVIISSSKSDYIRTKKEVVVEGFWSDAKRQKVQRELPTQIDKVFKQFHHNGKITGLSYLETLGLKAYDQTTLSDLFIGDDKDFAHGQEFTPEKLRLSQKTAELWTLIKQLDSDYGISFEIAERPEGIDFHGSIRIRPILHLVDQKIPGLQTIIISGFKSFETFFQEQVLKWSKKIGSDLKTASQGMKISLLSAVQNSADPLAKFMELSGLKDLFKDYVVNDKYQLSIVDLNFSKWYPNNLPKPNDYNSEHSFDFVVGLKGAHHQKFNQEIKHRYKLGYEHLEGRIFTKTIGGFKTGDQVISAVSQLLARLTHTLNWRQRTDLAFDTSHLRGALMEMYGRDTLPEFNWNFPHYSRINRQFLSEFGEARVNSQTGEKEEYTVSFDYENKDDVARWLKLPHVNSHNKFVPWNKVPFDQDQLWNFDPSIRALLGNALLWFQFTRIEKFGQEGEKTIELMVFKVGVQMVPNSPSARIPLVSPYQNQPISSYMSSSSLRVLDREVKIALPNNFANYLRKSFDDQEYLQRSLIGKITPGKSAVKLLSSDQDQHKLEVTFDNVKKRRWDFLESWEFVYDSDVPNQRDTKRGNLLSYILGLRKTHDRTELEMFDLIARLKEMDVMVFFEMVSHTPWNDSPGIGQYHASAKFRPILVYNKALTTTNSELTSRFEYKPVRNKLTRPLTVTGKVWEIFYKS